MLPSEQIEALLELMKEQLQVLYDRGVRDGMEHMRRSILQAVQEPVPDSRTVIADTSEGARTGFEEPAAKERAPRGLLRQLLQKILMDTPGRTLNEIEQIVVSMDSRVAVKSIYNQLNYFPDLYEKRGNRWFLKGWEEKISAEGAQAGPSAEDVLS
jgi:hypothetical protein